MDSFLSIAFEISWKDLAYFIDPVDSEQYFFGFIVFDQKVLSARCKTESLFLIVSALSVRSLYQLTAALVANIF